MPNERHKPGDIIWDDLERAGKNWEMDGHEALANLVEAAKLVKKRDSSTHVASTED